VIANMLAINPGMCMMAASVAVTPALVLQHGT
jgi:hypothetical protein